MSVRQKTLTAFGLTSLLLLVLLLVFVQLILMRGFDHLQEEAVEQNVQRVINVIDSEIESLSSFAGDWAYWDDTYQYVQDANTAYVESNLTDESISNLGVNLFIITDTSDRIVFGTAFDLEQGSALPIPDDLTPQSRVLHPLLNLPALSSSNAGIIIAQGQPMLVVSRPVLTSQKEGPVQGKLIWGRWLNPAKINRFAEQTQLEINIQLIDTPALSPQLSSAAATLRGANTPSVIYRTQDQTAEGYTLLSSITGEPTLIMQVKMPDSILQQGRQTVLYFVAVMLIAGLVLGGVIMWMLEKIILSRLAHLNNRVQTIAGTGQLSERIIMDGSDELSSLTATINTCLATMEESRRQLKQLNLQLEDKVNDLNLFEAYRDRFFTNAAHEFRTPMAVLRTQLYLAQKQPALWQKHLEVLENATNQLTTILDDVFDMAQFKRQRGTTLRQDVELNRLLLTTIANERPRMYPKGLRLVSHLPDHKFFIRGDQNALEQALEKLFHFVVITSLSGSDIQVSLTADSASQADTAHLTITASGLATDTLDLKQLFLPFYHSSEGHIRNSGLQLSIVKEVIEIHGGRIEAEQRGDTHIDFQITLPLAHSSAVPSVS